MRKPTLPRISEHEHQVLIITWATVKRGQFPELDYLFAIPNGAKLPWSKNKQGHRYSPEANKLTAEGMRPGAPDLCLPVPRSRYHGLYIELKANDGEVSRDQTRFLNFLALQNYLSCVCFGCDDAIQLIEWYLNLPAFGQSSDSPLPSGPQVAPFQVQD